MTTLYFARFKHNATDYTLDINGDSTSSGENKDLTTKVEISTSSTNPSRSTYKFTADESDNPFQFYVDSSNTLHYREGTRGDYTEVAGTLPTSDSDVHFDFQRSSTGGIMIVGTTEITGGL